VTQFLDSIPQVAAFVVILAAMIVAFEIGFRFGHWRETRNPEEKEGPTSTLVGALLALMAFLIAITMGMASDRFDTRRGLVQEEANAIHTAFLRAGYLPQPQSDQVQVLLRQYVPLRITPADPAQVQANIVNSQALMDQVWAITQDFISQNPGSDAYSAFAESVTDAINVAASRVTAIGNRVPEGILWFLIIGSVLSVGLVGYDAGLTMRRSLVAALLLIVLFSTVIYLVLDLNQPATGIFQVSQQPLITLEQQIGPPT
jgi:uncharacterized membrane protein